jgi:serine/threonine protein phosphatase PrpC
MSNMQNSTTQHCENTITNVIIAGSCAATGRRTQMEDASVIADEEGIFCIFDGHDGKEFANFVSHEIIGALKITDFTVPNLTCVFNELNNDFASKCPENTSGSTAVIVKKTDKMLQCAWVGDSEAWIISDTCDVTNLTPNLHNFANVAEVERIKSEDGTIIRNKLACFAQKSFVAISITRALGHQNQKCIGLSYVPEMIERQIQDTDKFLILACDGVRETMTEVEACNFVLTQYRNGYASCDFLAKMLTAQAIKLGSKDNISVIVVDLKPTDATDLVNHDLVDLLNQETKDMSPTQMLETFTGTDKNNAQIVMLNSGLFSNEDNVIWLMKDDKNKDCIKISNLSFTDEIVMNICYLSCRSKFIRGIATFSKCELIDHPLTLVPILGGSVNIDGKSFVYFCW